MGHTIFVTGTDTGVGKTFFTAGMIQFLRKGGVDAVGFKPIECGGRGDSKLLHEASGSPGSLDEINPIWFHQPVAPLAAADSLDEIDFSRIEEAHDRLSEKHELVMVEGAGGWHVPVSPTETMADLASLLADEVIIVAINRLGVISHSILTYRAVREKGLDCARFVLNHMPQSAPLSPGYGGEATSAESTLAEGAADLSLTSNARMIGMCLPDLEVFDLKGESCMPELVRSIFG